MENLTADQIRDKLARAEKAIEDIKALTRDEFLKNPNVIAEIFEKYEL